ncbi:hypothetical protein, partial [Klebsiella pneumoniae]|uniref:hypothetical protein n=1 Tax=Klebsiella pneumoniae TaxID=573 RepID=UPI0040556BF9
GSKGIGAYKRYLHLPPGSSLSDNLHERWETSIAGEFHVFLSFLLHFIANTSGEAMKIYLYGIWRLTIKEYLVYLSSLSYP